MWKPSVDTVRKRRERLFCNVIKYRQIDHTADFGIQVFGCEARDLFENAAFALFHLITDYKTLKGRYQQTITVEGEDWPDLMVNWLRELLYAWTGRDILVKQAEITTLSEYSLSAELTLDPYDPAHHVIKHEIKAVTYHQIQVQKTLAGWEAMIIFDV